MSMSQFNKWLKRQGVTKGPRGYRVACKGAAVPADGAERRLRVTITTDRRDRHGDVLEPGGAHIAAYLKNPVVLWAHDYKSLPIGRCESVVRDGDALKAELVFAPTDFAQEVFHLYAKGFLRAWSVGFLPLEWDVIQNDDGKFAGYHVRSWELIELSAVPVPANADALTDALCKGVVRQPALVEALSRAVTSEADGSSPKGQTEPDVVAPPEVSPSSEAFARALAAKLLIRLRPCLGDAVGREIRRRQGRLD